MYLVTFTNGNGAIVVSGAHDDRDTALKQAEEIALGQPNTVVDIWQHYNQGRAETIVQWTEE